MSSTILSTPNPCFPWSFRISSSNQLGAVYLDTNVLCPKNGTCKLEQLRLFQRTSLHNALITKIRCTVLVSIQAKVEEMTPNINLIYL